MQAGDRVILSIDMQELKAGMKGTVVVSMDGFPFVDNPTRVLAVQFDNHSFPSIARRIGPQEVYTYVISKCSKI